MSINMEAFQQFGAEIQRLGQKASPVEMPDERRLARAKHSMLRELDASMAMDLESCIHCGMCAEACHFYLGTQDPKYTPIHKLDLLKRVYRRELSPLRWLHRWVSKDITVREIKAWEELVYDSCTLCGRCSIMCPMGIHIADMVGVMRHALAEAGFLPAELAVMAREQKDQGTLFGVGPAQLKAKIEEFRAKGLEVSLDKEQADVLVLSSVLDIMLTDKALEATVKIMNHLGVSWTIRTDGYECANFGMLAGDEVAQLAASRPIIDAAIACGAKKVIVAECGHSYPALRWEAANLVGKPLPFEVLAISEFLGQELKAGRLRLKKAEARRVTFHDPCKNGRVGGVFEEPRAVLEALGMDLREQESHGRTNMCCGGGAGVFVIGRAAPLRHKVFELKKGQIDDTGAESLVVT